MGRETLVWRCILEKRSRNPQPPTQVSGVSVSGVRAGRDAHVSISVNDHPQEAPARRVPSSKKPSRGRWLSDAGAKLLDVLIKVAPWFAPLVVKK